MKSMGPILGCLVCFVLASTASADLDWEPVTPKIPLTSLPGNSLIVGDKDFSGFDLDIVVVDGGALITDLDLMQVQGVQDTKTKDYGLRFNGFLWYTGPDQLISINLGFKVSVLDEDKYIDNVSLYLTGAGATADGKVDASEIIWDSFPGGNDIARPKCWYYANDAQLSDHWDFDPLKDIYVQTKHISLIGNSGSAYFTEFFQFYGQVPEPTTLALLGTASIWIFTRKKHRPLEGYKSK